MLPTHGIFYRCTVVLLILSLVLTSATPALQAQTTEQTFLPVVASDGAVHAELIFRTRVTVRTAAQWRDLERLGVMSLEQGAEWALVLVDDEQLETLARLRFNPERTDGLEMLLAAAGAAVGSATMNSFGPLLAQVAAMRQQLGDGVATATARAGLRAALASLTAAQMDFLATAASIDTDNDGLTDLQESWWCTDPNRADSDFDGTSDGDEVKALKAWMNNERAGPPSTSKPFQRWPRQLPDCVDDDYDSVPDLAELFELGLRVPYESTDNDKFDDGQELFGVTDCPGGSNNCDYGDLPRSADAGFVGSTLPGWVKAPGNHPLVAAYPMPEIEVIDSSLKVKLVTTITDGETTLTGTEKSYSTAKTEGTSTSVADTETWHEWIEVTDGTTTNGVFIYVASIDAAEWSWKQTGSFTLGTLRLIGAGGAAIAGCGLGTAASVATVGGATPLGIALCAASIAGAATTAYDAGNDFRNAFWPDNSQVQTETNEYKRTPKRLEQAAGQQGANHANQNVVQNQAYAPNTSSTNYVGTQFLVQPNQLSSKQLYELTNALTSPRYTHTQSQGRSWGGSRTTTNTLYQEHTVTNGEAFLSQESWSKTTAVDSAHTANLTFSYRVRNEGTEYLKQLKNLAFNLYIGDDPNPVCTYFLATGKCGVPGDTVLFENYEPGQSSNPLTIAPIPLTLDQVQAIDLKAPIRMVVEDFSYGSDELFYKNAASSGVMIAIEDGTDDGDEAIDTYLIPTWGQETVLNVLARYFPHQTDVNGMMTAIWTPEYRADTPSWCQEPRRPTDYPNRAVWCKHTLSTTEWWNVYTDGLGDGSEGFQDTPAAPGSVALFRFNQDSDLDGFSDRSEVKLGTDPDDATSFPRPEVLAGLHSITVGNKVTATLSLLNTGLYDAYGVEAVMVAPDDSISITNNTVGGSGRVRAQKQVIVGSRLILQNLLNTGWAGADHAKPAVGGYYAGGEDRTYTFTVTGCPTGCTVGKDAWSLAWSDGRGASGTLPFGAGYKSPTFQAVGTLGLTLALYTGKVSNDESFTVAANTPRDTFQYTINRQPHTEPLVIVSYNDPQGNHRFVVPPQAMTLSAPTDNLQVFAGDMLEDVGVEVVTETPFAPGANSLRLLVNNPSSASLENAHLFLELINISGTVVSEVATQVNLPPGPTYSPITFNTNTFTPPYNAAEDYIVLAFLTDYQGNILDTAGRPLSSFQIDPLPKLASAESELVWNFGTAPRGALLRYALQLGNTGAGRLYAYVSPAPGLQLESIGGQTIGAADLSSYRLVLRTADLPLGAYDQTLVVRTSDLLNPLRILRIRGTITAGANDTPGGALLRPLDWPVTVTGNRNQGEWVEFTHTLGPAPQTLHPVKVFSQDYSTYYGVGKYATQFGSGTASFDMFGDGRDGVMPGSGNLDNNNGFSAGIINSGSAGSTEINVTDVYYNWRINPGDVVLIHQTQGTGAGQWELNKAVSDFNNSTTTATYQLAQPLQYSYSTAGNNRAQILRVPQYSACNVTGTVTPLFPWNGNAGGIFAVMCKGTMNVSGTLDVSGRGFRGGIFGDLDTRHHTGQQGESYTGVGIYSTDRLQFAHLQPNGGGGGGGGEAAGGSGTGGGGGYGTAGQAGASGGLAYGLGGNTYGDPLLNQIHLGSGGGGTFLNYACCATAADGGDGGGTIIVFAHSLKVNGTIASNGENGARGSGGEGSGGGSGGSIKLIVAQASLRDGAVTATGGVGGDSHYHAVGGNGGVGRIRIEYCDTLTGSTNPPASTQKLNCYIAEQIERDPYTTARLNLPQAVNGSATFNVQFGRQLNFAAAGEQSTTLRIPAGLVGGATLNALVSEAGNGPFTLQVDIGADGTWDWTATQSITATAVLTSPDLGQQLNALWTQAGRRTTGTLDIPVKVAVSKGAQILLTDLQLQAPASTVRYVRPLDDGMYYTQEVKQVAHFALDFTVGEGSSGPVSVAVDVGDDGTIDWSPAQVGTAPLRLLTGNLAAAAQASGGGSLIPLRIFVSPQGGVRLNDFTITYKPWLDLGVRLWVGPTNTAGATAAALTYAEGEIIPLQATLRNQTNTASGPVTAAFFAHAPGWGDWYIGSVFVANIPANGEVPASIDWNTTGFSGQVPVRVEINPYRRTGETDYTNNSSPPQIVTITPKDPGKQDQVITFNPLPNKLMGDASFVLNATASSGLPVSFASQTVSQCTISDKTVTLVAAGVCTIRASQTGNGAFNPAPTVERSFNIAPPPPAPLDQAITFAALTGKIFGEPPFALSATASSGLPVTFATLTPTICSISGDSVTILMAGECTVQASQPGNVNYKAAAEVRRGFVVNQAQQVLTFDPLDDKTMGDPPFALTASASSGLPIGFTAQTPAVCTVNGAVVTLVSPGACTIRAAQAGSVNYTAATVVDRTFTVKAAVGPRSPQTIRFGSLSDRLLEESPFTLSAVAEPSGLPVSFASETPAVCIVAGVSVTLIAKGTCTVRAMQPGNDQYQAAPEVKQSFAVRVATQPDQSIDFGTLSDRTLGEPPFTLSASASSGLPVAFAVTTPTICTVAGNQVTLLAVGLCSITATQEGNATYNPATPVVRSFLVQEAAPPPGLRLYLPAVRR
jgi:hypothetical protein